MTGPSRSGGPDGRRSDGCRPGRCRSDERRTDGRGSTGNGRDERRTPGRRGSRCPIGDDRALSAVVGKTLEAGIVVLYVSMLIGVLYGGVVPEYQAAAGTEMGERVLAESALEVQSAVPADPNATATARHDLPNTLDDEPYRIVGRNGSLALLHDDASIESEVPLALPPDVVGIEGEWRSTAPAVVRVERTPAGRVVQLEAGST